MLRDLLIRKTFGPIKFTVLSEFLSLSSSSFFSCLSLSFHFHLSLFIFIFIYVSFHFHLHLCLASCCSLSRLPGPLTFMPLPQNTLKITVGFGVVCSRCLVGVCWCGVLLVSCGCVVCLVWHVQNAPPCVRSQRTPCVRSQRPSVCRQHAHMCFNMCAWCRYTRRAF